MVASTWHNDIVVLNDVVVLQYCDSERYQLHMYKVLDCIT